ncbi:MAG: competence/damage-inducible protein A [Dichotomicrobium sp.]
MAETGTSEAGADVVTAGLIVIGDEVLSGRTRDKNIGHVAEKLTETGIQLKEVRIVADDQAAIVEAVNTLRERYDYVFTTGGIGPTHDDITADAIGAAFGLPVEMDPRAVDILQRHFRESQLTPARMRMTRMPAGAELIENPVSAAPGFSVENVYVMAGVPQIMQAMLDDVLPRLRAGQKILSRTIRVSGREGDIADILSEAQAAFPDIAIGSYPFHVDNRFGVNVVLRGPDPDRLMTAGGWVQDRLSERNMPNDVPGEDDVT